MYKLLQKELIQMNKDYLYMFSNKITKGMYIYDLSECQRNYEFELTQLGYNNIKAINSIEQINLKTLKDVSLVIIGVTGKDYLDFAIKFINLGLQWENIFAEKDVVYFIKCLKLILKSEKCQNLFLEQEDKQLNYYHKIDKNKDLIEEVYDSLCDELSKKVLLRSILKKVFDCPSYLDIYSSDQYVCDVLSVDSHEVIVDVGAYDGDTIKLFAKKAPKYRHIYAFEPDLQSFYKLVENTKNMKNIDYFSVGLADVSEVKQFHELDLGASTFLINGNRNTFDKLVLAGDALNIKPTLIKMDIEGFELEALKGFESTIFNYKPKLAICVYHKFEDIYDIPTYIKKINPNYKLFLRHHSSNSSETVLYAINY